MALPNLIILGARLTADPELRFSPSGAAVANFTVACNDRTFDKTTNEWKDGEATFLNCSVWRDQAENVAEQLHKGSLVNVYGRLKQRNYQTKDGEKRTVYEVDVDEVSPSLKWKPRTKDTASRRPPAVQSSDPWGTRTPAADPWAAPNTATDNQPPF